MSRLSAQHPNTVIVISTTCTMAAGLATHNFWIILVVGVSFLPALRRSARRHARRA